MTNRERKEGGGNVGAGNFCDACDNVSLIIWDWNACGLSGESLSETVRSLTREQDWDILLLQETLKHVEATTKYFEGGLLIHTGGGARGAQAVVLGKRTARLFREARCGRDFAMVRLEMVPR